MRVLGLDYGSKTVGVAVSDPLGLTAKVWKPYGASRKTSFVVLWHVLKRSFGVSGYGDRSGIPEKHEQYSRRAGREISGV